MGSFEYVDYMTRGWIRVLQPQSREADAAHWTTNRLLLYIQDDQSTRCITRQCRPRYSARLTSAAV